MKDNLLSFSFAMDDMDEIFLRVLDSTWLFLFWNNIDILWYSHRSNKRNPLKEMFVYSKPPAQK